MQTLMVVIPVHNGKGMIERTLDSLIAQSWADFEVVVIDNMSDDGTEEIIKEYIKRISLLSSTKIKLKYIKNKHNLGRIGNWNKALDVFRESKTDLCKIMFVGDTIEPDCLAKQMARITPDTQMITCAHTVINEDGGSYVMKHKNINTILNAKAALELSLKKGNWFAGTMGCVLFSKEALKDIKFPNGMEWAGDWQFWCKMCMNTNIFFLAEPLANFYKDSRKGYKRMAGSSQAFFEENLVKEYIEVLLITLQKI